MSDSQRKPRYILRPVVTPVAGAQPTKSAASKSEASSDPFLRPAQEDDDGYEAALLVGCAPATGVTTGRRM